MLRNAQGFPKMKIHVEHAGYRVLVIDLLYQSLDKLCLQVNFLNVITQITSKLQILHQNGIVHGDIKPENIMCLPNLTDWYLIDFGLSHIMDDMFFNFSFPNIILIFFFCIADFEEERNQIELAENLRQKTEQLHNVLEEMRQLM